MWVKWSSYVYVLECTWKRVPFKRNIMDSEWSSFYKWSLKVHVHYDLLFASFVKTAGYEHSMQSPSHTSALQIHSGLYPFILFAQHLHCFIQSKYDCSEPVLAQGPLKMSKPVGRMRGESIYCTPTLACTRTYKFRVEYMHSTWLICLWKWLLFFICFYEFQKNKNKNRVNWKVNNDASFVCLIPYIK